MKLYYKICTWATLSACALQVLLVVASWLLTAASPDLQLRSLLSGEGLRWLFGRFTLNLQSPVLVWMLLLGVAYGAMRSSGIVGAIRKKRDNDYRTRVALQMVACEALAIVVVLALLTLPPHAILLSATGQLFPSSFTSGLVPVLASAVVAMSLTYGVMVGRLKTVYDAFSLMSQGIAIIAPLVVAYIFVAELYHSILFVFGA
jgi:p-aminobenzoyl-glutamate transporter AbgT